MDIKVNELNDKNLMSIRPPKAAPAEAPKISGEARGFLKMP